MRCRDTFPLSIVIGCGTATRASRFGLALTCPELICRPSSHRARRGAISKRHPESPIYGWSSTKTSGQRRRTSAAVRVKQTVLRRGLGRKRNANRSARPKGGVDLEPVVGFESHADRECCRRKAF